MYLLNGLYTIATDAKEALLFLNGGAKIIQLRNKKNPETVSSEAEKIARLKNNFDFCFIVNDDPELANRVRADGVHVGKDDPSISQIKKEYPNLRVGYSSHSLSETIAAEREGADYIAFGAIFPSPTKGHGHPVQGIERLKAVVYSVRVPVVAIGGINRDNVESVLETGVAAFAMISALTQASDIQEEVRYFQNRTRP